MRVTDLRALALLAFGALLCACAGTQPGTTRAGSAIDAQAYSSAIEGSDDFDRPPRLISGKAPVYPIRAAIDGRSASVTLTLTIDETGRTRDIVVTGGDGEPFSTHAILAVREWRFEPAMKDGQPVAITVEQTITFGDGVPHFGRKGKPD
jgi:protein TonB